MKVFRAVWLSFALVSTLALSADDGLWMPQQVPALGAELKKLGLQIDPNQFADLTGFPMGAIVSLGGCSASFVSAEGLIITNHHCVYGALQYNATPENDLLNNGFLARQRSDEIHAAPDARAYVTSSIEDVTKSVLAPFPKKMSDADRWELIERRRREIVETCEKPGGLRCQVASFFEGAQYLKVTQMEIRDLRLVYAPPLGIGNFGGEVDNWMWPRHVGDFGIYRAYVGPDGKPADHSPNNVPYRPKQWLKISTRDLDEGDLVMVTGFPGITSRHVTSTEVEAALEFELPTSVRYRSTLAELLAARGANDRKIALKNAGRIRGLENYLKKHKGMIEAFRRDGIVEAKRSEEAALRKALPDALEASYDAAREQLGKILSDERSTRERDTLFRWLYLSSPMLTEANNLYRLSIERTKPDLDREQIFADRNRGKLAASLTRNRRSIEPGSDRAGLRFFLTEATKLPADQRILPLDAALAATGKTTAAEQVEALLDQIYGSTKIGDATAEKAMFEESTKQLLARNDSMIALAAVLRPFAAQLEDEVAARSYRSAAPRQAILEALRATRGGRLYPDANGTLRIGFGVVKGYSPRNAVWYQPQTDIRGVVEKNTGEEPFNSPRKLLDLAAAHDFGTFVDPDLGTLPVDFISTNVVTNGSSGSATLNAWGELCGLAFDVNWEGVGGDYLVNVSLTRTIHVDSRYILWIIRKIGGAENLLRELGM